MNTPTDTHQPQDAPLPGDGQLVGRRYRIQGEADRLGAGWIGAARDESSGTDVVVEGIERQRVDAEHRGQSASIMTRLIGSGEPACGHYTRMHEADDQLLLVRPGARGPTLDDRMAQGPLPARDALQIGRSVLSALAVAHERGVVHLDIRPQNIVVTEVGAVLTGFGRPPAFLPSGSLPEDPTSNIRYVAPEQAGVLGDASGAGAASDLYSAGAVLFELLAGRSLLQSQTLGAVLRELATMPAPSLRSLGIVVPGALDEVLQRLLRKDPAERYQSARAAAADLIAIADAIDAGQPDVPLIVGLSDRRATLAEPAFLGRETELGALMELVRTTAEGGGGLVLLEAESGGGKTRLIEEFAARCRGFGAKVLRGQGLVQSAQQPFQVLAGVAAAVNEQARRSTDERERLLRDLGEHLPAACAALPALADGLDVEVGVEAGPESFGPVRSVAALTALLGWVGAADTPAVVLLDDCQWADEPTVEVLHRVQSDGGARGVVIVAAFRTEEVGPEHRLRTIPDAIPICLPTFTPDDVRLLVASMAGPVPAEALDVVFQLSGGSPFMATAAVRGLVETGTLVAGDEGWALDRDALARARFSDRAGAVLARRIDNLSDSVVQFLTVGAVLGKRFDLRRAATLSEQADDATNAALDHARQRHFLWVSPEGTHCTFVHDKLREALLTRLTAHRRRDIHRAIAELLESEEPAPNFELAFHFSEAALPARALPYALAAATQARAQHALELAEAQYVIARGGCRESDKATLFIIAKGLAEVRTLRGRYESAREATQDARTLAVTLRDRAEMEGHLGDLAFRQGDLAGGIAGFKRALKLLGHNVPSSAVSAVFRAGMEGLRQILHTAMPTFMKLGRRDPSEAQEALLAVHILGRLTYAFYFGSGQALTLWSHLRGMNIAERYAPTTELADAYAIHGPVMSLVGLFDRGVRYTQRSLAIAEKLGDLWGQGHALAFESVVLYAAARYEACMETSARAVTLLERSGDLWDVNATRVQTAFCLFRQGRLRECATVAREVHESGVALGDSTASGFSLDVWARATGGGIPDEVLDTELARRRDDAQVTAQILHAVACQHMASGRHSDAIDALERGIQTAREAGVRNPYTVPLQAALASALRRLAQETPELAPKARKRQLLRARRQITRALWYARFFPNDLPFALREAGIIEALLGRERAARRRLDQAIAVADRMGAAFERARALQVRGALGQALGWDGAVQEEAQGRAAILAMGGDFVFPASEVAHAQPAAATLSLEDRFATVLDVGRRIASALTQDEILLAVRDGADELLRGHMSLVVSAPGDPPSDGEVLAGPKGAAPCWTTVRRALAADDCVVYASGDRAFETEALLIAGVRSALCVPIVVRGEARACLYVSHTGVSGLFGDEERRLATFISALTGAAWENADGFEKLERLTETLEQRVGERTAALEASNQQLQQFAYVASHDLQAPLRGVAGFAQLLEMDHADALNDEARGYLDEIVGGAKRMQTLIQDLLAYARAGAGERKFDPVDLDRAANEALTLLRAEIQESQATITCRELGTASGDHAQLRQLMQNLIGNALKYRREAPPEVTIWVERTETHFSLFVRDNGIGIDPQYHEHVFELFKRLHSQHAYPGTGVGLAVCTRIVQRHGGELTVESAQGEGSTFCARVPL